MDIALIFQRRNKKIKRKRKRKWKKERKEKSRLYCPVGKGLED